MENVTIKTNNQFRDVLYWHDLTDKERANFGYRDTELKQDEATFVRYRGVTYDLGEFQLCSTAMFGQLANWQGYMSDSFYSGIVIRYNSDFDAVVIGTYIA